MAGVGKKGLWDGGLAGLMGLGGGGSKGPARGDPISVDGQTR
jgi:hypothetical protein